MTAPDPDSPEQAALFEIEVDADDGCAWLVTKGPVINLGPADAGAEKLADWLAQRDHAE